jgi:hypothetical protein
MALLFEALLIIPTGLNHSAWGCEATPGKNRIFPPILKDLANQSPLGVFCKNIKIVA